MGPQITTQAKSPAARYARKKSSPLLLIVAVMVVVGIAIMGAVSGGLYFLLQDRANLTADGTSGSNRLEETAGAGTGAGTGSDRQGGLDDKDYFILLIDPNIEKDLGVNGPSAAGIARLRDEHLVKLREKAAARFRAEAKFPVPTSPPREAQLSAGARTELWNEHMQIYGAKVRNLLSESQRAKLKQMYDAGRVQRMEAAPALSGSGPPGWGGVAIPPGSDVRTGPGGAVIVNQPLPTGEGVLPMKNSGPVSFRDMDISHDGKLVAATYARFTKFWSLPDRAEVFDLEDHPIHTSARVVALSPNGKLVAVGHNREGVTVFEVGTWRLLAHMKDDSEESLDVTAISFSGDGKRLVAPISQKTITVWNTADFSVLRQFQTNVPRMRSLAITRNGKYLATVDTSPIKQIGKTSDFYVKVWDVDTGDLWRQFTVEGPFLTSLAFSPDGTMLASGSDSIVSNGQIWLFDLANDQVRARFDCPTSALDFSPDGSQLLVGVKSSTQEEGLVQVWDLAQRKPIAEFPQPKYQTCKAVRFLPDGKTFLVLRSGLGATGSVKLHEL